MKKQFLSLLFILGFLPAIFAHTQGAEVSKEKEGFTHSHDIRPSFLLHNSRELHIANGHATVQGTFRLLPQADSLFSELSLSPGEQPAPSLVLQSTTPACKRYLRFLYPSHNFW